MLERVKHDTISMLSKMQIRRPEDVQAVEPEAPDPGTLRFQHAEAPSLTRRLRRRRRRRGPGSPEAVARLAQPPKRRAGRPYVREQPKVGRNAPCPAARGRSTSSATAV